MLRLQWVPRVAALLSFIFTYSTYASVPKKYSIPKPLRWNLCQKLLLSPPRALVRASEQDIVLLLDKIQRARENLKSNQLSEQAHQELGLLVEEYLLKTGIAVQAKKYVIEWEKDDKTIVHKPRVRLIILPPQTTDNKNLPWLLRLVDLISGLPIKTSVIYDTGDDVENRSVLSAWDLSAQGMTLSLAFDHLRHLETTPNHVVTHELFHLSEALLRKLDPSRAKWPIRMFIKIKLDRINSENFYMQFLKAYNDPEEGFPLEEVESYFIEAAGILYPEYKLLLEKKYTAEFAAKDSERLRELQRLIQNRLLDARLFTQMGMIILQEAIETLDANNLKILPMQQREDSPLFMQTHVLPCGEEINFQFFEDELTDALRAQLNSTEYLRAVFKERLEKLQKIEEQINDYLVKLGALKKPP